MRDVRISILVIVSILIAVGIVMIYSASAIYADSVMGDSMYYLKRHFLYLLLGIVMMFTAMLVDINLFKKYAKPRHISAVIKAGE